METPDETTEENWCPRVLHLEVFPAKRENVDDYAVIRDSIKRVNFMCSQGVSAQYLAEMLTATYSAKGVKPDIKKAQGMLSEVLDKATGHAIEQFIRDKNNSWCSDLVQECRRKVETIISTKESVEKVNGDRVKLSRRYLMLNGARYIPSFRHLGIPIKHYIDSTGKTTTGNFKWVVAEEKSFSRSFTLFWDHQIGRIEFVIAGRRTKNGYGLDPHEVSILRKIQSGEYRLCTSVLSENSKGRLVFNMAYKLIPKKRELDVNRVMELANDISGGMSQILKMSLRAEKLSAGLNASAIMPRLATLKALQSKAEKAREACGSKYAKNISQGSLYSREVFSKRSAILTRNRDKFCKHWNHYWTAQVIKKALAWECGKIVISKLPDTLLGEPWQWFDFKFKLEYKAKNCGILIEYMDETKEKEEVKKLA